MAPAAAGGERQNQAGVNGDFELLHPGNRIQGRARRRGRSRARSTASIRGAIMCKPGAASNPATATTSRRPNIPISVDLTVPMRSASASISRSPTWTRSISGQAIERGTTDRAVRQRDLHPARRRAGIGRRRQHAVRLDNHRHQTAPLAILTTPGEDHVRVHVVAARHDRDRNPRLVALRNDPPLLRLAPATPPPSRARLPRPQLLQSFRHV